MLLVALGQGFSTTKKTTVLVISLKTLYFCATRTIVIYTRRSRPRGCQEEGGQRDDVRPQKRVERESCTTLPPCVPTCVLPSYRLPILCSLVRSCRAHRVHRLCGAMFYIRRIYAHACISVYPSIHTHHCYEIQIKSHALSTLIDAWCAA